jgi:hypothetical protein
MKKKQYVLSVLCLALMIKASSSPIVVNLNNSSPSDINITLPNSEISDSTSSIDAD